MKKHYISLLICLFLASPLWAQHFDFSQSSQPYTDLVGATSINGNTVWDDEEWRIPIGFDFKFMGITYDSVVVSDGYADMDLFGAVYADAFYVDAVDRGTSTSQSPISYQVSGPAGNRLLKIEWKNAGFYDGTANDFFNVQLWLYEQDSSIEVHMGPSFVGNDSIYPGGGPNIGLANDDINKFFYLEGPAASPDFNDQNDVTVLDGTPASGTVYRFIPTTDPTTGIEPTGLASIGVKAYPNPTQGQVHLSSRHALIKHVRVVDLTGRSLYAEQLMNPAKRFTAELDTLPAGIYILQVNTDQGSAFSRIAIK